MAYKFLPYRTWKMFRQGYITMRALEHITTASAGDKPCKSPSVDKQLRMDMDTTKNKNAHEKILEQFANREADVLVGTQMIVKGLML
mgnify:CR=1 FL=1